MDATSGTPEPGSSAGTPARPPAISSPTTNFGSPGSRSNGDVRELEVVEGVGDAPCRGQRVGAGFLDRHMRGTALERDLPLDRAAASRPAGARPDPWPAIAIPWNGCSEASANFVPTPVGLWAITAWSARSPAGGSGSVAAARRAAIIAASGPFMSVIPPA